MPKSPIELSWTAKKILQAFWKCRLFSRFVVMFLMFFIVFSLFDYSWTNRHEILALCRKLKVNTAYIMTCFVVTNRVGKPPIVGYFDPNFLPVFWGLFNPPEGWFHCKMCLTNGHWPIDHGLHWWLAPLISRIYETHWAGSELSWVNSAAHKFFSSQMFP